MVFVRSHSYTNDLQWSYCCLQKKDPHVITSPCLVVPGWDQIATKLPACNWGFQLSLRGAIYFRHPDEVQKKRKSSASWVATRRRWKREQDLFLQWVTELTQPTQSHYCCNVVVGRLCDGRMALPPLPQNTCIRTPTILLLKTSTSHLDGW